MGRLDGVTELMRRPRSAADARLVAERLQLQIGALNDLAGAIRFGERLEKVLPGVAEKAASLVGAEDALISIVEPDGALRLAIPNADDEEERIVFADDSHATRVARLGQAVIVNDLSQAGLSDSDLAMAREHGITGFIAVPLTAGDRLIGLLHVTQRADRRPYVEDDLELLSTFARQAAIAIENARL